MCENRYVLLMNDNTATELHCLLLSCIPHILFGSSIFTTLLFFLPYIIDPDMMHKPLVFRSLLFLEKEWKLAYVHWMSLVLQLMQ